MALNNVLNFPLVSRDIKSGTFVLDTAAYATNDVLCDLLSISVAPVPGTTVTLNSITLVDTANKATNAFTLYFFDRSVTMAAKNATWAVSDADMAAAYLGHWSVVAGDWKAPGASPANRQAIFTGLEIFLKPNSGTDIFIGAVCDSNVTAGPANSLSIKLGIY